MLLRLACAVLLGICLVSCRQITDTSPLIKQVKICAALSKGVCRDDVSVFSVNTGTFYASCILEKVDDEAEVTFKWFFYEKSNRKKLLETVVLKPRELSGQKSSRYVLVANLNRSGGHWPSGTYEVEVMLSGKFPFSIIKTFGI